MSEQARDNILSRLRQEKTTSSTLPPANIKDLSPVSSEHFVEQLTRAHATVTSITSAEQQNLPALIAEATGVTQLYCGDNDSFKNLSWADEGIELSLEAFADDGQWAISTAACAIAETGTLVLLSGNDNPSANNYLAEHHIVIVEEKNVLLNSTAAWQFLQNNHSPLPRAVHFISGPSSSADVGLKLEYGAHGPRSLWVYLLSAEGS